jgi:cysteine desulfurase
MIYFDNSATNPIHPDVAEAMRPYLYEEYGNPSSKYYTLAENAKRAVSEAREQLARLLGCDADEVVFTSGASESNNMVLKGVCDQYCTKGKHIVTTVTEHPSVLESVRFLETKGFKVSYLKVDKYGRMFVPELEGLLSADSDKPILVSVMWGNNELGSLNEIEEISRICNQRGIFIHTDATQVLGKVPVNVHKEKLSFLSCSAHKIRGPKGVGVCVIKKHPLGYKTKITPLIHGGGQENEYRSGTLSVHNIVGFGKAAELAARNIEDSNIKLKQLETHLLSRLDEELSDVFRLNSDIENKVPGIVNLRFPGVNNELLIQRLSDAVAISTGSACSSTKPSHVLSSIGLSLEEIRSSVRISFSAANTIEEIDEFIRCIA